MQAIGRQPHRAPDSAPVPVFVEVSPPTDEALQAVLHEIITCTTKLLTRRGVLVDEQGSTYMADNGGDSDEAGMLGSLQAAACTYRIAFGASICRSCKYGEHRR